MQRFPGLPRFARNDSVALSMPIEQREVKLGDTCDDTLTPPLPGAHQCRKPDNRCNDALTLSLRGAQRRGNPGMQVGVGLVEMLLVIAIAAVIITLGIRHYRYYEQQQQTATLESKIHTLQWAFNRYFHQQGCFRNGVFRGNYQPSILQDLLYDLNPDIQKSFVADNWVASYQAQVIGTPAKTALDQPIYKLQLVLTLSAALSAQQIQWLYQRLQANQLQGRQLIWTFLPGNTLSESGNGLWVLKASREQFRQSEQQRSKNLITLQNAYSYCAH